jgi:hypothetical protein
LRQNREALRAILAAWKLLAEAAPSARDFYVRTTYSTGKDRDVLQQAEADHYRRLSALSNISAELAAIVDGIAQQAEPSTGPALPTEPSPHRSTPHSDTLVEYEIDIAEFGEIVATQTFRMQPPARLSKIARLYEEHIVPKWHGYRDPRVVAVRVVAAK